MLRERGLAAALRQLICAGDTAVINAVRADVDWNALMGKRKDAYFPNRAALLRELSDMKPRPKTLQDARDRMIENLHSAARSVGLPSPTDKAAVFKLHRDRSVDPDFAIRESLRILSGVVHKDFPSVQSIRKVMELIGELGARGAINPREEAELRRFVPTWYPIYVSATSNKPPEHDAAAAEQSKPM